MGHFITRVMLDYSYASERTSELGSFWQQMIDKMPPESEPDMWVYRFVFATVAMTAENAEQCRAILYKAWDEAFPDTNAIKDIYVTPYGETEDLVKLMRSIYNNYYGVEEYQKLVTELNEVIPMLKEKKALSVVKQTNYLFAMDGGCGFTTLLSSFGNYLQRMDIYEEGAETKRTNYGESRIGAEDTNGYTTADTLIDSLKENTEENKYNIIGIDISYYLDKAKQEEFREFLKRLYKYNDDYVFMFHIPFLEKQSLDDVAGSISDIMMLKVVQIPPLSDIILVESFWDEITGKDFTLDTSVIELMTDRIRQEKIDGRFYGFKTVEKMACEVILKKTNDVISKRAKGITADAGKICPEDIPDFVDKSVFETKGYAALGELIGMEKITERIREIISQVKIALSDKSLDRPCIHMRFTGSPGTGKTTVARILGQIMKEEGILRKGAFLEYAGRDLCASYVGQTAVKTASICRDSYGSVLFIDEAYSLYNGDKSSEDYGREAIATLVSEMENHRDDMLVIMAGYTDEMAELMKSNPGLRSRMPYVIEFPNYTRQQLFEIYMLMVKKHFEYDDEFEKEVSRYFDELSDETLSSKEFANARFVRNLYERTWSKGALRSSLAGSTKITLAKEDFLAATGDAEFSEKLNVKKTIGFK
ncbi:MAG: AAA family ATPase [Lachnospiraceae bacterium]|nr:AAA family ATPase [Lachnospiraceae bacterium]